MIQTKRSQYWLITILIVAFAVRSFTAVWWQSRVEQPPDRTYETTRFHFGDSGTYWYLAKKIANGDPYEYGWRHARVLRTPGYPLILAPLFLSSENPAPLMGSLINVLLGTVTVWLVFILARMLFDERVGLVAAAICAIEPGAIGMSVFVLSEGPFCLLGMLHLICWIAATRSEKKSRALLLAAMGGVFCGLAILVRPSWLLFLPFAAGWILLFFADRSRHVVHVFVMLITMSIVMTPWCVRNWYATGHFVPTTLQTGSSLYDGLHADATGGSNMDFVRPEMIAFVNAEIRESQNADSAVNSELLKQLDAGQLPVEAIDEYEKIHPGASFEYDFNRYLGNEAKAWAIDHPIEAVRLGGKKLWQLWSPFPSGEGMPADGIIGWVICLTYVPLVLLAIYGVVRYRNHGVAIWLCVLPAVYFTLLHTVFVSSMRYRQPAMLPLLVLAAAVVVEIWSTKKRSNTRGAVPK